MMYSKFLKYFNYGQRSLDFSYENPKHFFFGHHFQSFFTGVSVGFYQLLWNASIDSKLGCDENELVAGFRQSKCFLILILIFLSLIMGVKKPNISCLWKVNKILPVMMSSRQPGNRDCPQTPLAPTTGWNRSKQNKMKWNKMKLNETNHCLSQVFFSFSVPIVDNDFDFDFWNKPMWQILMTYLY